MRWQTEEYTLVYTVQNEVLRIPSSEFEMGSDVNADEKPIHTVFIDTFYHRHTRGHSWRHIGNSFEEQDTHRLIGIRFLIIHRPMSIRSFL